MKIRSDFVSNSSSSSFIVSNEQGCVTLLFQKYAEIFRDCPASYDFANSIIIYAYTKRRDYQDIYDFIALCNGSKVDPIPFLVLDENLRSDALNNEDEECQEQLLLSLNDFTFLASRPDLSKKIIHLYFSTESDFNSAQDLYLASLFRFFDAIGCYPDASSSERDFLKKDLDRFEQKLEDHILKAEKQKENQI